MKHSFNDLHRIFDQSITAREIAVPLVSFEIEHSAKKVHDLMEKRGFDIVGAREGGAIVGYIRKADISQGMGALANHVQKFSPAQLVNENSPLLRTIDHFRNEKIHWLVVQFLGNPSAIITRADLQKTPTRLWIFGLISLFEMIMLEKIRRLPREEAWSSLISPSRLEKAKIVMEERLKADNFIDLAECLQWCDKKQIFAKSASLLRSTSFSGCPKDWKTFMDKVEKIRNLVAHASNIKPEHWPEHAETISIVENCIRQLEKDSGSTTENLPSR